MESQNPTIGSLVWHLSTRWRTEIDRVVAPLGLTHAQYSVLASVHAMSGKGQPPTQRELADFMGLTPIYVSKLLRALEAGGNLSRARDPRDSRAYRLVLTETGLARIETARTAVRQLDAELTRPLGPADGPVAQDFLRILKSLIQHQQGKGETE